MALPTQLDLQIVTPERLIVHEQVDEVEIPGSEGYFGVLPGHTPLLASLAVGELWYRKGQEKCYLSIAFGFAEVLPDRVTILARLAERAVPVEIPHPLCGDRYAIDFAALEAAVTPRTRTPVAAGSSTSGGARSRRAAGSGAGE